MNKECNRCNKTKPLNDFYASSKGKHGRRSICKQCDKKARKPYKRTIDRLLSNALSHAKYHCKERNHDMPEFTSEELKDWFLTNGGYALWCQWAWSNFAKEFVPSIDRIDTSKSYILSNIQLVTWATNDKLGRSNSTINPSKNIKQYLPNGKLVESWRSVRQAYYGTGIGTALISKALNTKTEVGGFLWESHDLQPMEIHNGKTM